MMQIRIHLQEQIHTVLHDLFEIDIEPENIAVSVTRPEFEGEYTLVVFPLVPKIKRAPHEIAAMIGERLQEEHRIKSFNVVKGFLNMELPEELWYQFLEHVCNNEDYGQFPKRNEKVIVEYSSPNTNKPLHLGHIRNILLGWSTYEILKEAGYEVIRTQIINDRGIAICKSMLAWQKWGEGTTPEKATRKGDHLVGDFYVMFESRFQEEYQAWQSGEEGRKVFEKERKGQESEDQFFKRYKNEYFNQYSTLGKEARDMLLRWEKGETETIELWKKMNGWVYDGFGETYDRLKVKFDKNYYESDTYILGREIVEKGLEQDLFYREEDQSVWVDLEAHGMDQKILQRSDGTSVYITQDLGTAEQRYEDYHADRMIYVVADEQNYHFEVLFKICEIMERPYAAGMYHLSYGMVDLPTGRMKSREGTVVDADDLMEEVKEEARKIALEKGEINTLDEEEQDEIVEKIGMAALKFHMIKVDPRRRMVFDPKESVDMQGQTGPYIQNAYVRIRSILRREEDGMEDESSEYLPSQYEKEILVLLAEFPEEVLKAAESYDPSVIANFAYRLARSYHRFYGEHRVLSAESTAAKSFRLSLSRATAQVLERSMNLLGIEMPSKM